MFNQKLQLKLHNFWKQVVVFRIQFNWCTNYYIRHSWVKAKRPFLINSVQSLSRVWLFGTPWITACQSITNSLEFTQTHAHRVNDAIQPSHPLSSPSPPAPNPSQHQGLFQWANSLHEVAEVLEFQLQHFNWKIITFQYCDCFCHTSAWISHRGTCVPPSWTPLPLLSPPHPSELFQSTSFECPASCIELAVVTYFIYGDIHGSVWFSQIVPPLPSLSEPKSLCLFCCLTYRFIVTIFLNFIHMC